MDFHPGNLSIEMRKIKQMINGSRANIWRHYLTWTIQEKAYRFPVIWGLQSVDHWSILESPKSSIIAVVGEAGQQMLFAAQERGNYQSIRLSSTAELSVVLKPGLRVSTSALLVKRKWSTRFPAFASNCMWTIPSSICTFEYCNRMSEDSCGSVKQTWFTVSGNYCCTIVRPAVGFHMFLMLLNQCTLEFNAMLNFYSGASYLLTPGFLWFRKTSVFK